MKLNFKVILVLIMSLTLFSCSVDTIENDEYNISKLKYELPLETNVGSYKGIFTTLNSEYRGVIDVTINEIDSSTLTKSKHVAKLVTENGEEISLSSFDNISNGNINFTSDKMSFTFFVNDNGSDPIITNVVYENLPSDILIAKHSDRAQVIAVTGTYNETTTSEYPGLGGDRTFSLLFLNNGDVISQVLVNDTLYEGIAVSNCITPNICDLNSGDGQSENYGFYVGNSGVLYNGARVVTTNLHEVVGQWSIETATWGLIEGTFSSL